MPKPSQDRSPEQMPTTRNHEAEQDRAVRVMGELPTPASYPIVAEAVAWSDVITLYDRQHFITYARLLDAERNQIDWRQGAREILLQNPDQDPQKAWICWETHLERARWIATVGLQQAAERTSDH